MRRRTGISVQNVLSLILLAAVTLLGQSNPSTPSSSSSQAPAPPSIAETPSEPSMVLKVTTRLVVVDVVVTDRHGAPVTDLKPGEFTILEDGKEQKITVFALARTNPTQIVATKAAPPPAAQNAFSPMVDNLPHYKPNGALNVLLLDGLNTTIRDQKYAREQMLKLLARLPNDRPVAIYLLGRKLSLLQDFTSDPTLLREASISLTGRGSGHLD